MPEVNTETLTVDWCIETGYAGGTHKGQWVFLPGELPMDPEEQEKILDEYMQSEMEMRVSCGWSIREDA